MAINRSKIISDMSEIEILGNEKGIIEAFGVYLNQLPTTLWNNFADRLTAKTESDLLPDVELLLVNAAQECGYHTGHGILTSDEWNAIVQPMVENNEDILHGLFAIFSGWGWAKAEIEELIPGERMVVRAYNYYEADVVKFGKSNKKSAYLIRGVCAGFMALVYSGYFQKDRSKIHAYTCIQTKGLECGDSFGEFVVEKATEF